jgi:iron complex outermembrane receptor protein
MQRRALKLACVGALVAASAAAGAQSTGGASGPQEVDRLVVTATREGIDVSDSPASVTIVTSQQIEQRRAARIGDVLGEVPGVYLRNNAQSAQFPSSGQASIAIRGVPRTTRTLVMIDGQPINNVISGGIDLTSIMLDNVSRIEIVRGPYSALYGGNAMGGVINVLTKSPAAREFQAKVEGGFGDVTSSAASLVYRDRLENGLGISLALGYRHSGSWKDSDYVVKTTAAGTGTIPVTGAIATTTTDNRAAAWVGVKGERPWDQRNAELKLVHSLHDAGTLTAGIAFAGYRVGYRPPESFVSNAAGQPVSSGSIATGLAGNGRVTLAETDFFNLTPSNERDWRGFLRWEHNLANGTRLVANLGHMDHNFRFTQPAAGARYQSGPGEWSDQPNQRTDADMHARWLVTDQLALTAGAAVNRQHLDRRGVPATMWRDYATHYGENSRGTGTSHIAAAFGQAEYTPLTGLTLHAGARFDRFSTSGKVSQSTAPAFVTEYAKRSEQQFSPKLAAVFNAGKALTLRASIGEGFRPPTLLDLYSRTVSPTTVAGVFSTNEPAPNLKAERIRAYELGMDARLPGDATLTASAFSQTLSDLIYRSRLSTTLTQSANAGRAKVTGFELSLRQPVFDKSFTLFAAATHLAKYDVTENAAIAGSVGKKLTDVPGDMFSGGVEFLRGPWSGSLIANHVGHIYGSGDDTNINTVQGVFGSYDARTVLNAKVSYRYDRHVIIALSADNLLNKQYFDFYKQPGMTAVAEVIVRF